MSLFISPEDYFSQMVQEGLRQRKIDTIPRAQSYLVELLQHYMDARNLFEPEWDESGQRRPQTLAEMYMTAAHLEQVEKSQLLKKLGDKTLYISGFFGDSLTRKIVDVDYYAQMGGAAYRDLSECTDDVLLAQVYKTFSHRFIEYMDVLTYISQRTLVQSNESLLRLYDRYLKTGSPLAREKLMEMGIPAISMDQAKKAKQF